MDFYTYNAGIVVDENLYFSSNTVNGLYRRDLITNEVIFLGTFPNEKIGVFHLHKDCVRWNNLLVFLPETASYLHIWDLETKHFICVDLERNTDEPIYADGCVFENCLYIFPAILTQPLLKYNLLVGTLERNDRFSNRLFKEKIENESYYYLARIVIIDEFVLFPIQNTNTVYKYSLKNDLFEKIKLPIENIFALFLCDNRFFISCVKTDIIYACDLDFKEITEYLINDECDKGKRIVNNVFSAGRDVYAIPAWGKHILKLNINKKVFEKLDDYPSDFEFYELGNDDVRFFRLQKDGDNIIIFPRRSNMSLIIKNGYLEKFQKNGFSREIYIKDNSKHYKDCLREVSNFADVMKEDEKITLSDYLYMI